MASTVRDMPSRFALTAHALLYVSLKSTHRHGNTILASNSWRWVAVRVIYRSVALPMSCDAHDSLAAPEASMAAASLKILCACEKMPGVKDVSSRSIGKIRRMPEGIYRSRRRMMLPRARPRLLLMPRQSRQIHPMPVD
jgi:hypothetical protein